MKELAPFLFQGLLMTVDEFYCHHRRELRRWERVGHPLDTLGFAVCLGFLWLVPSSQLNLYIYAGLSLFSCFLISKDEWEHRGLCSGFENWLHAMLFMVHPVVLIWAGVLWWKGETVAVAIGLATTVAFFLYQVTYWNWWRRDQ